MESYNVAHFSVPLFSSHLCVKVKLQLNSNKVALCLEDVTILHQLKHFITQITSLDGFCLFAAIEA